MEKELQKKETNELATNDLMDGMFDGSGLEGSTTSESFLIPMMKIVQTTSPVMDDTKPEYNEDAKKGNFWDPAQDQLFTELTIRVLSSEHQLVVWAPGRSGLIGVYRKDEEAKIVATTEGVQKWDKDGNEVVDTIMFTCCHANDLTLSGLFFMPMSISSFKYGRALNSKLMGAKFNTDTWQPDKDGKPGKSWMGQWSVKTVQDSNDKGSWFTVGTSPKLIGGISKEEIGDLTKLMAIVNSTKKDVSQMGSESESTEEKPNSGSF